MSRIGKAPITVPAGVDVKVDGRTISVKGPKGTLAIPLADEVTYNVEDGKIAVIEAAEIGERLGAAVGHAGRAHAGIVRHPDHPARDRRSAADAVPLLDKGNCRARIMCRNRRRHAGRTCPEDDDVYLFHANG